MQIVDLLVGSPKLKAVPGASQSPRKAAERNEAERVRRLREDAKRPLSVNLAEGIALSHKVAVAAGSHLQRGEALLETPVSISDEPASNEQVAIETDLGRPPPPLRPPAAPT
jgi:hypothetical protein